MFCYHHPDVFQGMFNSNLVNWPPEHCPSIRYLVLDRGSSVALVVTPVGSPGNYVINTFHKSFSMDSKTAQRLAKASTFEEIDKVCTESFVQSANPWCGNTLWMFCHELANQFEHSTVTPVDGHESNCKVVDFTAYSWKLRTRTQVHDNLHVYESTSVLQ